MKRLAIQKWMRRCAGIGMWALMATVGTVGTVAVGQVLPGAPNAVQPGSKWVGVACGPIPEVVRAHVKLDPQVGIMVQNVIPDSPAAAVGIKAYDILVKAGEADLRSLDDLVQAVQNAPEEGIVMQWWRAGEQMQAQVRPAPRPQQFEQPWPGIGDDAIPPAFDQEGNAGDLDRLRSWLQRLEQNRGQAGVAPRLRFFPRAVVPNSPGNGTGSGIEGSISVQIQREGDGPAKIHVERNGEVYDLTEDDLDKLPEDIRGYVQSMIGGEVPMPDLPGLPNLPSFPADRFEGWQDRMENLDRRMEEMLRRMEEFQHDLHPAQPQPAVPAEPGDNGVDA